MAVGFSIYPNGTSSPTTIDQSETVPVASAVRSAAGVWAVTLNHSWPKPQAAIFDVQSTDGVPWRAIMGDWTAGSGSTGSSFALTTYRPDFGGVSWVKSAADAAAGTVTANHAFFHAKGDGRIVSAAKLELGAAVADDASDTAQITVRKNPASAYGTQVVVASWDTTTGQEGAVTADTPSAMTLSGTAANLALADTDSLTVDIAKTGNGVAVAEGAIHVEFAQAADIAADADNAVSCVLVFDEAV